MVKVVTRYNINIRYDSSQNCVKWILCCIRTNMVHVIVLSNTEITFHHNFEPSKLTLVFWTGCHEITMVSYKLLCFLQLSCLNYVASLEKLALCGLLCARFSPHWSGLLGSSHHTAILPPLRLILLPLTEWKKCWNAMQFNNTFGKV